MRSVIEQCIFLFLFVSCAGYQLKKASWDPGPIISIPFFMNNSPFPVGSMKLYHGFVGTLKNQIDSQVLYSKSSIAPLLRGTLRGSDGQRNHQRFVDPIARSRLEKLPTGGRDFNIFRGKTISGLTLDLKFEREGKIIWKKSIPVSVTHHRQVLTGSERIYNQVRDKELLEHAFFQAGKELAESLLRELEHKSKRAKGL